MTQYLRTYWLEFTFLGLFLAMGTLLNYLF